MDPEHSVQSISKSDCQDGIPPPHPIGTLAS